MKKLLIAILFATAILLTSTAATYAQNSVQLPNGETVTGAQVQEIFNRCAMIAGAYKAGEELLEEKDAQLRNADARIRNLEEQVTIYRETVELYKQAISELKAASEAKDKSIERRDKEIDYLEKRVAKLEKKRNSLWSKIKTAANVILAVKAVVNIF